jgi:hypothetical protein
LRVIRANSVATQAWANAAWVGRSASTTPAGRGISARSCAGSTRGLRRSAPPCNSFAAFAQAVWVRVRSGTSPRPDSATADSASRWAFACAAADTADTMRATSPAGWRW